MKNSWNRKVLHWITFVSIGCDMNFTNYASMRLLYQVT